MKNDLRDMEFGFYVRPFDYMSFLKFTTSYIKTVPYFELNVGPFSFEIGWIDHESIQEFYSSNQRDQA